MGELQLQLWLGHEIDVPGLEHRLAIDQADEVDDAGQERDPGAELERAVPLRSRKDQHATGPEEAAHLGQRSWRVTDVFDHLGAEDQIEVAAGTRTSDVVADEPQFG